MKENQHMEWLQEKHLSSPYNPFLANAFFRAGYIESWGRGIEKINRACREHGIATPVYDSSPSRFIISFHIFS